MERGKRLTGKQRRQLVRHVADEMMNACACPTKRHSTEVAKKMIAKYPRSLVDDFGGDVVGTGYYSWEKQLQTRIENTKRDSIPKIRKRTRESAENSDDTDEIPAEKRAAVQDTYGCIKWDVKFMPLNETSQSQEEKKQKMKELRVETNFSPEEVKTLMECTYYSQRKRINTGTDLQSLLDEWPFLFQEIGMMVHFQQLTGKSLNETFLSSLEKKGKRLLNYLKTKCADENRRVFQAATRLALQRGELEGCSEEVKDMVLLLLSYFDEKEENLFHYVEETCLANEIQVQHLPVTPCIIVCGKFMFTFNMYCFKKTIHEIQFTMFVVGLSCPRSGVLVLPVSSLQEPAAMPQSSSC